MHVYGVQLHDFTPNGLLHIACYFVLCECFLGVAPHFALFRRIFNVKRQHSTKGPGGFGVQARPDVEYFKINFLESVQGWRQKWFYIKDVTIGDQTFGLPAFDADALVKKRPSWIAQPTGVETEEADILMEKVLKLQTTAGREVTGIHLLAIMAKRRVQPLRARVHALWAYGGASDPTRSRAVELSDAEAEKLVRSLTKLTDEDPCDMNSPVPPYETSNPLPKVTIDTTSQLICYACVMLNPLLFMCAGTQNV
jgi:hypothetical protein